MDVMLSDNAKRYLCRAGFVLLCAIPTLVCLNLVLFPRTNREWSAHLQQQFGVINEIGQIHRHTPGRTDFTDLRIGADQFQSRLNIDSASIQTNRQGTSLFINHAQGSVQAFWQSIRRMIENIAWTGSGDQPVQIHFAKMTFLQNHSPSTQACVWNDIHISGTRQGQTLTLLFKSDRYTDQFVENQSIVRVERTGDVNATSWSIDARGFRIPGWVLNPVVPMTSVMNVSAELANGQATLVNKNGLWSGEFCGQLLDVDLGTVVAERFGTTVTGRALVNIKSASIRNSQIESIDGDLYSQTGIVGSRLLNACTRSLEMQLVEPFGQSDKHEIYTDMRFGFRLNLDQIAIYGMQTGAVLNDAKGHRMLIAQHGQNKPVASLIELVSWPMERFNADAAALAKYLVIRPTTPASGSELPRTAHYDEVGSEPFFNR